LVVDASVAVKWIVAEEQEAAAEALLLRGGHWLAPDFLVVEVANVMRTKTASGQLDLHQAQAGLRFVKTTIDQFIPDGVLVERAPEIAADLNHAIYDCLHIACAERQQAQLMTADQRFIRKIAGSPYDSRVQLLDS
jgi:predicted nucleic acid-binding protein